MTKGELLESTLIKVNGGVLTSSSRVKREDINALLSAAINWAILGQYRVNRAETGESEINGAFVATFENVKVQYSQSRGLHFIDLPAGLLPLPKNYGLQSVSPMMGTALFAQINFNDQQNNAYYSNSFSGITLYWIEGQKVYFQNISTDKVLVRMIQSADDLPDDAQLPLPAGTEIDVLNILSKWFSETESIPSDYKNDNNNNISNRN